MKRVDTIKKYRDEFLKGKSEEQIRKFDSKDLNKQYGSIMAWKRREGLSKKRTRGAETTPISILDGLRNIKRNIVFVDLSEREIQKISGLLSSLLEDLSNFETLKMEKKLNELLSQRNDLEKEIARLQDLVK